MKIRYTVAWKIGTGFTVLIILTMLVFYSTNNTLTQSKRISDDINEIYNPSVYQLELLKLEILQSNALISEWYQEQRSADAPYKLEYIKVVEEDLERTKNNIRNLYNKLISK